MADWVDRKIGGFCKEIQDQIDSIPFLDPVTKQKYMQMLDDCATKATDDDDDTIVSFKKSFDAFRIELKNKTGTVVRPSFVA